VLEVYGKVFSAPLPSPEGAGELNKLAKAALIAGAARRGRRAEGFLADYDRLSAEQQYRMGALMLVAFASLQRGRSG
jgi:hypothetical protein